VAAARRIALLRGGYSSGYPAFGCGLRVPYLGARVDYAYWGDELGMYAGQQAEWNQQLTLAWSWGDQKGRAYGNDANKKDAYSEKKKALKQQPPAAMPAKANDVIAPAGNSAILVNGSESTTTTGVQPATAVPATAVPPVAAPTAVQAIDSKAVTKTAPEVVTPVAPAGKTPGTQNKN